MPSRPSPAPTYNLLDGPLNLLLTPGTDLARMRRTAEALRDHPALLRSGLKVLRNDADALAVVAGDAEVHENGFAKVVLSRGEGWSLRLHVWSPRIQAEYDDGNPHGHRWSFASWIITGTLRETTFARTSWGQRFLRLRYGRRRNGDAYLDDAGTAALVPVEEIDRVAGTVYQRTGEEVHTAAPRTTLVATLVLHGESEDSTEVFRRPHKPEGTPRALTPEQLELLLADVIDALR